MSDIHGTREELVAMIARQSGEIERLQAALSDARDALHNDFEPDNQSNAYKRATRALGQEGRS